MRSRLWISTAALAGILAPAWIFVAQTGGAQTYKAPRTPWGDPDLQGQWNSQTATPLERPLTGPLAEKQALTDEEAEEVERRNRERADSAPPPGDPGTYNSFWMDVGRGLNRASLIIDPPDGRVPAFTPAAEQRFAAEAAERATRGPADSYADLPIWTRCITRGWNGIGSNYSSNTQIFQSPGYVVVLQELIHEPRIIPLDDRPGLPADVKQWLGVSRGYFEGDTLVVETRNFDDRWSFRGSSSDLVLVERYTRISDDEIDYEFTMHDPSTYVRDWTVVRPMRREADRITIFEYACHEGNIAMTGILAGARKAEQDAAAQQ